MLLTQTGNEGTPASRTVISVEHTIVGGAISSDTTVLGVLRLRSLDPSPAKQGEIPGILFPGDYKSGLLLRAGKNGPNVLLWWTLLHWNRSQRSGNRLTDLMWYFRLLWSIEQLKPLGCRDLILSSSEMQFSSQDVSDERDSILT
jgi:hypothetical protein